MGPSEAVVAVLKKVSYLSAAPAKVLERIASRCRTKTIPAGQIVFSEGSPCRDLHVLGSGRVSFYRANADGREQILRVFEKQGETFCLASAFTAGKHIVSARAATTAELHLLDVETLNGILAEHPAIGRELMKSAGEHMTHLVQLADDLALKTVVSRLAKHLLQLAAGESEKDSADIRLERKRLSEEELAALLGTVRVHVSRSLANLARTGAIEVQRESIRIRDAGILKRIAEGK